MSWQDEAIALDEPQQKPKWLQGAIPLDSAPALITQEKPSWMADAVPLGEPPTAEQMQTPAYKMADAITSHVPYRAYAVGVARGTPPEQRDQLLDAVYNLAREKKAVSGLGWQGRTVLGVGSTALDLGELAVRATGLERMDEGQKRFTNQLLSTWKNADPLTNPDAPWYDLRERAVNAGEALPGMLSAGGAGKFVQGGAEALGAGVKVVGLAGKVGTALGFAPKMFEDRYDSLLEKGVAPSTARWAAATSAGLGSLLFAALPGKILPRSWTAGTITEKLADNIAIEYAKTALYHGPTAMAGARAVDAAVESLAQGQSPEILEILKNTAKNYPTDVATMGLMAAPGALAKAGTTTGKTVDLRRVKQERVNSEIIKAAEDNTIPSRTQWKDWGLNGRTDRESRYMAIRKIAEGIKAATQSSPLPEVAPVVTHPEQQSAPVESPVVPPEVQLTPAGTTVPGTTSTKLSVVDELRAARGEQPLGRLPAESVPEWIAKADEKIKTDPELPNRLVSDLQNKPRGIDPTEEAVLQLKYRQVNNSFTATSDKLFEANKTGNPEEIAKAQSDANIALDQVHSVEEAAKNAHGMWGKTGVAMQIALKEDFSLGNLVRRTRVAKGGAELTPEEGNKIKEMSDKIAELQSKLDSGMAEPKKGFIRQTAKREAAKKDVDAAWVDFREAIAGRPKENILTGESGALNLDVTASGIRLAKAYAKLGVATVDEFLTSVKGVLGEEFEKHKDSLIAAWKQHAEGTLQQRVEKTIKLLDKSISKIEGELESGKISFKKKTEPVSTTEMDAKRVRLKELQQDRKELIEKIHPEIKEQAYTKSLENRLAKIQQKVTEAKTGVFPEKIEKDKVLTKYQTDLKFQINEEKARFKMLEEGFKKSQWSKTRTALNLVPEALNASRAILTSMDLSAVLRQGGIGVASHPIIAAKAFPAMFKAWISRKGEFESMEEIRNRPNAGLYEQAKLAVTTTEGRLSSQEEAYMGHWSKRIPGVAASERAYVTFLNRMRADIFDSLSATLVKQGDLTLDRAKVIANYVNVITGRGDLGSMAAAAVPMATIFFAPRYAVSRFQFLLGQPMWKGDIVTRKLIAKEYAKTLIGLGTFYGTLALSNYLTDDKHRFKFEFDPRSADFGKVQLPGGFRIDPLSGLSQTTVLMTRLFSGLTKASTGEIVPIRNTLNFGHGKVPFTGMKTSDAITRFLRGKLSPWLGSSVDIAAGENVVGEETTPQILATRNLIPLSFRDIYDAMQTEGIPRKTALSLLVILGMGAQKYEAAKPENFAFKIAQHETLRGQNTKTKERYDYTAEVSQIVAQAKKLGITKQELSKSLTHKLIKQGYTDKVISEWQDRLFSRYNR